MAVWNVPLPRKSGADFPTRGNPGLSLLPLSAWTCLGMTLRLSPREMQIVQGVFGDRKEETIAGELGISPHTVNTYFQRVYAKLGVSSRPQLIVRVMAEYLNGEQSVMAVRNHRRTRGNPGLSLLPLSVWFSLGMALRLSRRETQIVQGVFDDRKEETIACELGISPHTVNSYFQRLYAKLRVSSRPGLIVRVMAEYLAMAPGMLSARVREEDGTRQSACAGASEKPAPRGQHVFSTLS